MGQITGNIVSRHIRFVSVDTTGFGAALRANTTGAPVGNLYAPDQAFPEAEMAGLKYNYQWGLYSEYLVPDLRGWTPLFAQMRKGPSRAHTSHVLKAEKRSHASARMIPLLISRSLVDWPKLSSNPAHTSFSRRLLWWWRHQRPALLCRQRVWPPLATA